MSILVVVPVAILAYALISRRTAGSVLTAPMFFTACGLLLSQGTAAGFDLEDHEGWVHWLPEVTLVVVLFTDASRIDLGLLRREHRLPMRMLALGLPMTIVFGTVVAALMFPGVGWADAALIAAILAPTDAALGQAVVTDGSVPVRVRQTLNVESGLNDGIALPAVLLCASLAGASSEADGSGAGYWLRFVALQIALGPVIGATVGGVGGWLLRTAIRIGWAERRFASLATLSLALMAFAGAEIVGGNGFLAAFISGMVLGNTTEDLCDSLVEFGESEGQLLSLLTFGAFGALLAPIALERLDFANVAYAIASLTVIRAVPVVLSLTGQGLRPSTLAFLAWFGPRGIASILFALVVVERSSLPYVDDVMAVVGTTVLLSIVSHGVSAAPWARWYGRHAGADVKGEITEMPLRHGSPRRARQASDSDD